MTAGPVTRLPDGQRAGRLRRPGADLRLHPGHRDVHRADRTSTTGCRLSVDPPALGRVLVPRLRRRERGRADPGRLPRTPCGSRSRTRADPGLDVSGDGRGSNTLTGQFTVYDAAFAGTTVTRFAAAFEQHSEGTAAGPGRLGHVQLHLRGRRRGAGQRHRRGGRPAPRSHAGQRARPTARWRSTATARSPTRRTPTTTAPTASPTGPTTAGPTATSPRSTITVNPVNDAPVAPPTTPSPPTRTRPSTGAAAGDADVDGDPLDVRAGGTARPTASSPLNARRVVHLHARPPNYNGPDSFTYKANDGDGRLATRPPSASRSAPVNDAPVRGRRRGDARTRTRAVAPGVLADDRRRRRRADRPAWSAGPAHGTLTLNADGVVHLHPGRQLQRAGQLHLQGQRRHARQQRRDRAHHRRPVNDAPVAADDSRDAPPRTRAVGRARWRPTDVDGDALTYAVVDRPGARHADARRATATFTYTPAANYNGPDSFTYKANDGTAGLATSATVTITVTRSTTPRWRPTTAARPPRTRRVSRHRCATTPTSTATPLTYAVVGRPGPRHADPERRRHVHLHAGGQLQRPRQLHLQGQRRQRRTRNSATVTITVTGQRRAGGRRRRATRRPRTRR